MDLNHSIAFKSAAANSCLQDFIKMPIPVPPEIPQPTEVVQEGTQQKALDPLKEHLKLFWAERYREIRDMTGSRQHQLPLARIKKVMKSDELVQMVSADAPIAFAKACEFLILELTSRAWLLTEEGNRSTLQRSDIANAICKSPSFDFLLDIVPRQQPHVEDDREHRRAQGQRRPPLPHGPPNKSDNLNRPIVFNGPCSSNMQNEPNVLNGLEVLSRFIVPCGSNSYNGPSSSNVQNGPNVFNTPSGFIVPSGANKFDEPYSSNVLNRSSFPRMDLSIFQQHHNVVEEFYGANMGAGETDEMFYSPGMNFTDQFHHKVYNDNQAGLSNFQRAGHDEAEFEEGQVNEMHFNNVGCNMALIQDGTLNMVQFDVDECKSDAEPEPQIGPFDFSIFGCTESETQTGTSSFGIPNEPQVHSREGKRSRLQ